MYVECRCSFRMGFCASTFNSAVLLAARRTCQFILQLMVPTPPWRAKPSRPADVRTLAIREEEVMTPDDEEPPGSDDDDEAWGSWGAPKLEVGALSAASSVGVQPAQRDYMIEVKPTPRAQVFYRGRKPEAEAGRSSGPPELSPTLICVGSSCRSSQTVGSTPGKKSPPVPKSACRKITQDRAKMHGTVAKTISDQDQVASTYMTSTIAKVTFAEFRRFYWHGFGVAMA